MRELLDPQTALLRVLIAGVIGLVAGLGRVRVGSASGLPAAGPLGAVWTAMMAAMLGATVVLLTGHIGRAVAAGFGVVAVATGAVLRPSDDSPPGTLAAVMTLLAYWCGAYAGRGDWTIAGTIAGGLVVLATTAPALERRLCAFAPNELRAALTFAVVATIVLYALPDANIGPWRVWNPRRLWGLVVLVSALSFAAFVAMRVWQQAYGAYLGGALGGFVSSTAVTVAFAHRSRTSHHGLPLAIGASLASLVMVVRVGALAQAAGAAVVQPLLPFLGATLLGGAAAVVIVLMRAARPVADGTRAVENPFQLRHAVRFALFYALVKWAVEWTLRNHGAGAVSWAAALAGLVDVDAITLTLAGIGGRTVDARVAARAIGVAVLANTAAKLGCAMVLGDRSFRRAVGVVLGATFLAGAVALVLTT